VRPRGRVVTGAVSTFALLITAVTTPVVAAFATVAPIPASVGHRLNHVFAAPPTTADCQAVFAINCYSPNQLRQAYDVKKLSRLGITGAGQTIAIVDSFGSPTIAHDLAVFDRAFGLPDPPSIRTITPAGKLPRFDADNPDQNGWAFETTLDVEYAHAIAPKANILVVATPVSETEGVTGFPEIVKAENYVVNHHLANVISQSFGASEGSFGNPKRLLALRSAFKNAAARGVTVLGASGDSGATDFELDGVTLYPHRANSWPSTDPLVTSVGGTQLHLNARGNRTSPDEVWNDGAGAGGGGLSRVFARPAFQNSVRSVVGTHRGTPDISMSAAVDGGAIVYLSYDPTAVGWAVVGGTSEATPLFAGVIALAAQVAHHGLGVINAPLYALQQAPRFGIVDVTRGNNSFNGVTGYPARKGYDLASGLGTVDAARFVYGLAAFARAAG
jgi:subtilase family serine protease